MPRATGFMASWVTRALSAAPSTPALDTRKPAAIEMIRAGIWLTRPSPMVIRV
jgi:transposase